MEIVSLEKQSDERAMSLAILQEDLEQKKFMVENLEEQVRFLYCLNIVIRVQNYHYTLSIITEILNSMFQ